MKSQVVQHIALSDNYQDIILYFYILLPLKSFGLHDKLRV
ncbi:hypothetical protein B194_1535 [Serratia plymuthica A30]|nr:hypothetical protein B194_1535 [Serratia plymuthica A30]